MAQAEQLVLLRDSTSDLLPPDIAVVHQISNRLLLVHIDDNTANRIRNDDRVLYVGRKVPAHLANALTPTEQLFLDGWLARSVEKPDRPGDELPWDAEGMIPPDMPPDGAQGRE